MNPEEFFANYIAQQQNTQASEPPQAAPMRREYAEQPGTQTDNHGTGNNVGNGNQPRELDHSPVRFISPDGSKITEAVFKQSLDQLSAIPDSGIESEADLNNYYLSKGYQFNTERKPYSYKIPEYKDNINGTEYNFRNPVDSYNNRDMVSRAPYAVPGNPARTDTDTPVTNPEVANNNVPVTVAGIQSGDVTPRSSDVAVQPQPRSPDITPQPQNGDTIVLINPNDPNDKITLSEIEEWERQMKDGTTSTRKHWQDEGVSTREDFIRYKLAHGYQLANNDSNLVISLGNVGDNSHEPGPVHTNETTESTNAQLDELNGFASGDVSPQNTGSSSWQAFSPLVFGFSNPYLRG